MCALCLSTAEGMRLGKLKGRIKQAAGRARDVAACCAMPADGDRVAAAEALAAAEDVRCSEGHKVERRYATEQSAAKREAVRWLVQE